MRVQPCATPSAARMRNCSYTSRLMSFMIPPHSRNPQDRFVQASFESKGSGFGSEKGAVKVIPRRKAGEAKPKGRKKKRVLAITVELLTQYYGRPLPEVATLLGIGATALKSSCRKLGIRRWPMPRGRTEPERLRSPKACESPAEKQADRIDISVVSSDNKLKQPKPFLLDVLQDLELLRDTAWRLDVGPFLKVEVDSL